MQLEYQYRPKTPRGEKISRIYENGIYRPPDMVEKPRGLWFTRSYRRPRESCSLQTAPQPPAVETSDLDAGLELHRDTTERDTPPVQSTTPEYPLTPGAARTTGETFYEPAGYMEDLVDKLQAIVEERMPWLKKRCILI